MQAYPDIPQAHQDCQAFRQFMMREYNVPLKSFRELHNKNKKECLKVYTEMIETYKPCNWKYRSKLRQHQSFMLFFVL